jgi:hypothetical protein
MGKTSSKARATAPGSLKNTEERLRVVINELSDSDPNIEKYSISGPVDIIPAKPIEEGNVIIEDYNSGKVYSVPFTTNEDGDYSLGEKEEVNKVMNYEAVKSSILAVEKAKDHVLFTGTALIPGEPDCDAENGEELLTAEKVARIAHSFMDYRIIDKEHEFQTTKKTMGEPVESYLLDEPKVMKNIKGEEREYPAGTWVVKSKITDPEMMESALKGEIAYSVTVTSKENADKIMASVKSRVLIKEVKNPVGATLALTKNPCVDNSCSTKSATKSGRKISKNNKSVLEKARDILNGVINQADPGSNGGDNVSEKDEKKEYVEKSEMEDMVKTAVKTALKEVEDESSSKNKPAKCPKCDVVAKSADDKFCSECGTEISEKSEEESKKSKEKEDGGSSKAIKNHDGTKETPAFKSTEYYMGRNLRGRPVPKEDKK